MSDLDKKISTLISTIKNYRNLPNDYNNLKELIDLRKDISTNLFSLSIDLGYCRDNWKLSELKLENKKSKLKLKKLKNGEKLTLINLEIKEKYFIEEEDVLKLENKFYEIDYITKFSKEILNELNQRISIIKDELKQNNFFSNGT